MTKFQYPSNHRASNLNLQSLNGRFFVWLFGYWKLFGCWCLELGNCGDYLLQPEQLPEEQLPQDELAVLVNFPPLENAKADIFRLTFLLLQLGQPIFSEELKTNFSNS
jgi:hypothetical protein